MQVSINAAHLKAAAYCAGEQDIRHYLNGVLVEARTKETRLVATNGECAAVLRDQVEKGAQDEMPDVVIPNATIALALQTKSAVLSLVCDAGKWSLAGISFNPVDGRFPDYRRIIPASNSGEAAQFNPARVAAMAKAGKLLGRKDSPIIRHNGMGAAQVQFYANDEFVGVLMPLCAFTEKNPDLGLIRWGAERAA
jgi:DNA polymerase III subunit beta